MNLFWCPIKGGCQVGTWGPQGSRTPHGMWREGRVRVGGDSPSPAARAAPQGAAARGGPHMAGDGWEGPPLPIRVGVGKVSFPPFLPWCELKEGEVSSPFLVEIGRFGMFGREESYSSSQSELGKGRDSSLPSLAGRP